MALAARTAALEASHRHRTVDVDLGSVVIAGSSFKGFVYDLLGSPVTGQQGPSEPLRAVLELLDIKIEIHP